MVEQVLSLSGCDSQKQDTLADEIISCLSVQKIISLDTKETW